MTASRYVRLAPITPASGGSPPLSGESGDPIPPEVRARWMAQVHQEARAVRERTNNAGPDHRTTADRLAGYRPSRAATEAELLAVGRIRARFFPPLGGETQGRATDAPDPAATGKTDPQVHAYLSTYCFHLNHPECRLTCKTCGAACRCACHSPQGGSPQGGAAS